MTSISKALCFCSVALLVYGCSQVERDKSAPAYTEQDLAEDLAHYAARFSSIVSAAADEIADKTESRRARRSTLIWKLRLIPLLNDAAFQDDPQEAYVEVLALAVAMQNYFSEGDARELFGEHQSIAIAAADELETAALDIGRHFLEPEQAEQLTAQVEELSRKNPIRGRDFSIESVQVGLAKVEPGGAFAWAISLPMSPFRAFEGVGSGAAAMHDLNKTADKFAEILDQMPQQNRWQIELLLYDMEERDTVSGGLDAFQQVAQASERTSLAVEKLPENLRDVLADTRAPITEANEVVVNAQKLMVPVAETARELRELVAIVAEMQKEPEEAEQASANAVAVDEEPGRPFDVREYEDAARALTAAAVEVRSLIADARDLAESGTLDSTLGRAIDGAEDEIAQLLDRTVIRLVIVVFVFFAILLAYRWTAPRSRTRVRAREYEKS